MGYQDRRIVHVGLQRIKPDVRIRVVAVARIVRLSEPTVRHSHKKPRTIAPRKFSSASSFTSQSWVQVRKVRLSVMRRSGRDRYFSTNFFSSASIMLQVCSVWARAYSVSLLS